MPADVPPLQYGLKTVARRRTAGHRWSFCLRRRPQGIPAIIPTPGPGDPFPARAAHKRGSCTAVRTVAAVCRRDTQHADHRMPGSVGNLSPDDGAGPAGTDDHRRTAAGHAFIRTPSGNEYPLHRTAARGFHRPANSWTPCPASRQSGR